MTVDVKHKPLEISHHLKSQRPDVYGCDYLTWLFVLATHTVNTWSVHCPSIVNDYNRSKYSERRQRAITSWRDFLSMLLFRKQKKKKGWISGSLSSAISALTQIQLFKLTWRKKIFWVPIFWIHDIFNSWNGRWLNSCKRDMEANSCYAMMLFWWCCIALMIFSSVCVCVALSGLKKQKSDPAFTAKLWMKALWKCPGSLPLSPHPLPYYQSEKKQTVCELEGTINWTVCAQLIFTT